MSEKSWIVKAFHTGGPYQKYADKLLASAKKFDIPIDIEVIESRGSWNANTHYKPTSILFAMSDHPDKNIWHVDVDAWFMQYPKLFDEPNDLVDVAAFHWGNKNTWCSGTVFCRNPESQELLHNWIAALHDDPKQHGDQVALGKLLDSFKPLRVGTIPAGYLQGLSKHLKPGEGVIAHDGARKHTVGTKIYTDPK